MQRNGSARWYRAMNAVHNAGGHTARPRSRCRLCQMAQMEAAHPAVSTVPIESIVELPSARSVLMKMLGVDAGVMGPIERDLLHATRVELLAMVLEEERETWATSV